MPAFVGGESVLERVADDALDPAIHGRIHLDAALQEIRDRQVGMRGGQAIEHVLDDGRRAERFRTARHDAQRQPGSRGHLGARKETLGAHERQDLVPAAEDRLGVRRGRRVVARRLRCRRAARLVGAAAVKVDNGRRSSIARPSESYWPCPM